MEYDYDCVIIGAGLSGLAAGIRLAHFDKKVLICERHSRIGGLNSYYARDGITLETGLHGITNFAPKGASKSLPLMKLLRQLRIPYESLMVREQNFSLIKFPDTTLRMTNDFADFEASVADNFPASIDGFRKLDKELDGFDETNFANKPSSARQQVSRFIQDPKLIDMLFCPLMYYGSATPDDMDFSQFTIMYKSVFKEGFFRPAGDGIRTILDLLLNRFLESGGELRLNCGISRINSDAGRITSLVTDRGENITAGQVLSSAGSIETFRLCRPEPENASSLDSGQMGYIETVMVLDDDYDFDNHHETIVFFNNAETFSYRAPREAFNTASGVICLPRNFQFKSDDTLPPNSVRSTVLANGDYWLSLDGAAYREAKELATGKIIEQTEMVTGLSGLRRHAILQDAFTPKTIARYTGHANGAIYGAPFKFRDGRTSFENLFLCGTDQGFLGITGSMLSGISIANTYLMRLPQT